MMTKLMQLRSENIMKNKLMTKHNNLPLKNLKYTVEPKNQYQDLLKVFLTNPGTYPICILLVIKHVTNEYGHQVKVAEIKI